MYERCFKRIIDIICSLAGLVVLWPLMLVLALLIKIKLGSPVLFKQDRPGLYEKIFLLYKFRTMTDERDERGELLSDAERLTKFGIWLRSTSLDELPELINIIKGDMSIVGPRPLLVEYLPRYSKQQRKRHNVRPGITGYAQISGRNSISWEKRFQLDVEYINHITFFNDCKIILKTIRAVLLKEGIDSKNAATMEDFLGNYGE